MPGLPALMNRNVHVLLGELKKRGWAVTRSAGNQWRASHASGRGVTICTKPSARGRLEVERQIASIERQQDAAQAKLRSHLAQSTRTGAQRHERPGRTRWNAINL